MNLRFNAIVLNSIFKNFDVGVGVGLGVVGCEQKVGVVLEQEIVKMQIIKIVAPNKHSTKAFSVASRCLLQNHASA